MYFIFDSCIKIYFRFSVPIQKAGKKMRQLSLHLNFNSITGGCLHRKVFDLIFKNIHIPTYDDKCNV